MSSSLTRLDLTEIFCDIDDFYRAFETSADAPLALPYEGQAQPYRSRLSISEVMTIIITFHGSGYRTFKDFYTRHVLPHWQEAVPDLVSYTRFVELVPSSVMALACDLQTTFGKLTGISFIDQIWHPTPAPSDQLLLKECDRPWDSRPHTRPKSYDQPSFWRELQTAHPKSAPWHQKTPAGLNDLSDFGG